MMKFAKITLLAISLSPYGYNQAIADIYKTVDKSGHIYYTDCPAGGDYKLIINTSNFNLEKATKLAKSGNADAQFALGCSVTNNYEQALMWFRKAAERNHSQAQYTLGAMYFNGNGVTQDYKQAFIWYQKAAKQGDVAAQYVIGNMYKSGEGVPKDPAKAVKWLQKAGGQGHAKAQFSIGTMYEYGDGIPKDFSKALEWYRKAAVQGDPEAQVYLGSIFNQGEIVDKDRVQAYAWFNLAAVQGDANGQKKRDELEKELTDSERTEGQRLASSWKKGNNLLPSTNAPTEAAMPNTELRIQSTGTAFIVSSAGHMLTNYHVVKGCAEIKVAGRDDTVKVVASDSVNDLALLQLSGETHNMVKLNQDAGKLRQGEDIFVYGYPLNFVLSSGGNFTPGIISALAGLGNNINQLQITAPIQPGSSGSPVMDKKGNLVGMVSMMLDDSKLTKATGQVGQNVNFAINGQTIKAFLDANQVTYKTGGGLFSFEKNNADIAEEARKWTMLVECWK